MNNKRKGLYYCRINSQDPNNKGVIQKCLGMVKGFKGLGAEMDMVWHNDLGILFNESIIFKFPFGTSSESLKNIVFNHLFFDLIITRNTRFEEYDFLFIRYPLSHPGFIYLLKVAKSLNPNLKIFLEVPTFPYSKEQSGILRKIQLGVDNLFNRYLKNYIDRTVHYGLFENLFGIPSVAIQNGIDVASNQIAEKTYQDGLLRLIAVGNWNYWHGLDRLIRGLGIYYSNGTANIEIELTVIGGGRMIDSYKRLAIKEKVTNKVKFVPPIDGVKLNHYFNLADIAIGCLGIFRKEVKLDSSLKHRLYCSRGIPFILTMPDIDFPNQLEFVKYFPQDDNPIDVFEILDFYIKLKDKDNLASIIKQYSEQRLDWKIKLSAIYSLILQE